jgi:sulfatase-like protein
MTGRRLTALARALHAIFFLAVSAYCALACTPFAYDLFIKPGVSPGLTFFVRQIPTLFWVVLLVTLATFFEDLNRPAAAGGAARRGRAAAWAYLTVSVVVGLALLAWQPSSRVDHPANALALAVAAACWPVWLAAIDHAFWPAPAIRHSDVPRLFAACAAASVAASAVFAVASALRMHQTVGVDLSRQSFAAAALTSAVLTLFVFMLLFLLLAAAAAVVRTLGARGAAEYWLLVAFFGFGVTWLLYAVVCESLAFQGRAALVASASLAAGLAAAWAGLARLRAQMPAAADAEARGPDAMETFAAPVCGRGSRRSSILALAAAPLIATAGIDLLRRYDWNFLLQKIAVLVVWMLLLAALYTLARFRRVPGSPGPALGVGPLAALLLYGAVAGADATTIDRYAALDPSVRLVRDAQTSVPSETAGYYALLRSHTLLPRGRTPGRDVDFVAPLAAATERPPHIFLIVVDSLRQDYLSPYNPAVTFTPEIATLAKDSFVYRRALTRYGGTAMSVPAIWAGGMVPHTIEQPEFGRRNTLLKLLDANRYRRFMDMDSVVTELMPRDPERTPLDSGNALVRVGDFCSSVGAVTARLREPGSRPIFYYSLPQNAHVGVTSRRAVPPGESYPGFDARVASSLHELDRCLGTLVRFLRDARLYDESVIILTSDHGDLLGEDGRWGHVFWMYPQVVNIPLIVHVPPRLRATLRSDLDAAVFSTDIAPSLYALLGYEPKDLGPLFGRPFVAPRNAPADDRRTRTTLVASSYGAVYGLSYQNGRRLYVVDTVDGREFALDLGLTPKFVAISPSLTERSRRLIAGQLSELAAMFGYQRSGPGIE